ncbi:hypothetical protein Q3G72_021096 [Acer saccharum]|nr:hypothetical protein Q3G72_021096 [Acer saccharum]
MTIRYITNKSPLFMVKAGLKLEELPSEQEWKENLDKVSLMDNLIREIPSSMSPNCQILSTLLLQDNPLESIPESFLSHMHGLKILNLSGTSIKSLPNSISELTNLIALLLQNCRSLKHVPSLARLRALAKLELGYTAINEVPIGMEMLANLKSLDIFSYELNKIPAGILPKLCRLQKLRTNWGLETQRVAIEEGTRLKNLNSLMAQFFKLQDFNYYTKYLNSHGILNEYFLLLSHRNKSDHIWIMSNLRSMYDLNKMMRKESHLHHLHLTKSEFKENGGKHWSGTISIHMLKLSYFPFVSSVVTEARSVLQRSSNHYNSDDRRLLQDQGWALNLPNAKQKFRTNWYRPENPDAAAAIKSSQQQPKSASNSSAVILESKVDKVQESSN